MQLRWAIARLPEFTSCLVHMMKEWLLFTNSGSNSLVKLPRNSQSLVKNSKQKKARSALTAAKRQQKNMKISARTSMTSFKTTNAAYSKQEWNRDGHPPPLTEINSKYLWLILTICIGRHWNLWTESHCTQMHSREQVWPRTTSRANRPQSSEA